MPAKAEKKSAKRKFYRKLKLLAKGSVMFLLALVFVSLAMSLTMKRGFSSVALRQSPYAVVEVKHESRPSEILLCTFKYRPATPFFAFRPNDDFLYKDEDVRIAPPAETIDAAYLEQALALDETATAVTYEIADMADKNLSQPSSYEENLYSCIARIGKSSLQSRSPGHEKSYELYEEELPEGIVRDEFSEIGTEKRYMVHHADKSVRDVTINVSRKPYYFGPEPVIAIVIDDMGINVGRTRDISSLHAPLTSSFLTYGTRLDSQVKKAENAGHEIMIHVPMEPRKKANLAPDTLMTDMDEEEIKRELRRMLAKFGAVKGINNHMGSRFTEDRLRMSYVMDILREKDLFFLDSKTSAKSVGKTVAEKYKVPYAHRHVFLDNENDFDYIMRQLEASERLARRNGYAVAIGHPKSQTYKALKKWLEELDKKKIRVVHLSEIIKVLNPQYSSH